MPEIAKLGGLSPSFNRQKRAFVTQADNGFVVALDNLDNYEQTIKVAKDTAEVADIMSAYFA